MMVVLQQAVISEQSGKSIMAQYHLSHRAILRLEGEGPVAFVHDILTADIASLTPGQMRQSCLLSPQGRILVEMVIYIPSQSDAQECLYIACDVRQSDELMKKLKLYRLRRKITMTICEDIALIASDAPLAVEESAVIASAPDTRAPSAGYHTLLNQDAVASLTLDDISAYHGARIANAIPEGPDELIPNRALMLEAGLDLFEAVDFKKGCYIGQEVTARTRYRGLVKRRLVPVIGTNISSGTAIMAAEKEVGTILTSAPWHNERHDEMIGLASIRLTAIHDALEGKTLAADGTALQLAIPHHLTPLPKAEAK